MEKIWIIMNEDNRHIVAYSNSSQEAYDKICKAIDNSFKYSALSEQRRRENKEKLTESFNKDPNHFSGFGYYAYVFENKEIQIK